MEPIELLQEELDKYKKALIKSKESLRKGEIDPYTHQIHYDNLIPKIQSFVHAINTLKIFG
jgi:hypothetical protein